MGGQKEEGVERSGMIHFQFTNILKYGGLDTRRQQVSLLDTTWCVAKWKTSGNPHGKLFLIRVISICVVSSIAYPLLSHSWNRRDEAEHVVEAENIAPPLALLSFLLKMVLIAQEAAHQPFCS